MRDDSGTARRRSTRTAHKSRRARWSASSDYYTRPPDSVAWALQNWQLTGPRFTPYQRVVLWCSWTRQSLYGDFLEFRRNGDALTAKMMGEDRESVKQAREAAERLCYELRYAWWPALEIWQAQRKKRSGARLTPREEWLASQKLDGNQRKVLKRHARGMKAGRKAPQKLRPVEVPTEDLPDHLDREAGRLSRFSELESPDNPRQLEYILEQE
jgi:hypothetical protein